MGTAAAKTQVIQKFREWMTLDEARAFLGKSEKSIQRLKRAGHLKTRDESREGKAQRLYSGADLERIKAEAIPASAVTPDANGTGMIARKAPGAPIEITIPVGTVAVLRELFAEMRADAPKQITAPQSVVESSVIPVSEKLWLSISEAAALSGLSESYLLTAITDLKVVALKGGAHGAWRINRASLEAFRG
jgi:hypothetical protein